MTSEDLQAHYRTEPARMLAPDGGRDVNPKTTAWMLKHTATTEGGTYTPETGARTWIWSDLHLHHKNIIRYCNRPFQSVEAITGQLLVRLVSLSWRLFRICGVLAHRTFVQVRRRRRATVRGVDPELAARPRFLRLTQARIGDTLQGGNGTRVAVVNAFTTVNPDTEAIVRAVD